MKQPWWNRKNTKQNNINSPYFVLPLLGTIIFFLFITVLIAVPLYSIAWDVIEEVPRQERQKIITWPDQGNLGWTNRHWEPGESFIDPEGKAWKISSTSFGEVSVWPYETFLSLPPDSVCNQDFTSLAFHVSFQESQGSIVLIYPQKALEEARIWERVLTKQGFKVHLKDYSTQISRGQIKEAYEKGPLAIIRLHEKGQWNWEDAEGTEKVAFLLDRHPRVQSNLSFVLRWQEELPKKSKAVIIFCRQSYGQHLFPRTVDIVVPQSFKQEEIETLSASLARAIKPFS
ncbi:hypothetical protein F9B85_02615 [Heliorestis acidaminivorans]|uniref:Uncharacterized protein n=1 Tax=Heliorestis acidaminivorans TaxID=553427 RepID=A0A6I0F6Z4_9FIRM|nr:hypothetical protein [Heliorestis acidaminivorans]KAB2954587.1 hypothetical protein F9B85_02615 [Heliorestis acidaminivorans]